MSKVSNHLLEGRMKKRIRKIWLRRYGYEPIPGLMTRRGMMVCIKYVINGTLYPFFGYEIHPHTGKRSICIWTKDGHTLIDKGEPQFDLLNAEEFGDEIARLMEEYIRRN